MNAKAQGIVWSEERKDWLKTWQTKLRRDDYSFAAHVINFKTLSLNVHRRTAMDTIVRSEVDRMSPSVVKHFLRRVSRRQKTASLARQWRFILLIAMGSYASALLASRLFGLLGHLRR
jgi:hypothetical protein